MMDESKLAEMIQFSSNNAWNQLINVRDFIESNDSVSRDEALADAISLVEIVRDYAARLNGDFDYMPDASLELALDADFEVVSESNDQG